MMLSGPFLVPAWQDVVASKGTGSITKRASFRGMSGIPRKEFFVRFILTGEDECITPPSAVVLVSIVRRPLLSPMLSGFVFRLSESFMFGQVSVLVFIL